MNDRIGTRVEITKGLERGKVGVIDRYDDGGGRYKMCYLVRLTPTYAVWLAVGEFVPVY